MYWSKVWGKSRIETIERLIRGSYNLIESNLSRRSKYIWDGGLGHRWPLFSNSLE